MSDLNALLNLFGDPEFWSAATAIATAIAQAVAQVGGLVAAAYHGAKALHWLRVLAALGAAALVLVRPLAWAYRLVRPRPNEALQAVLGHLRDPDPTFAVEKCGKVATLIAGDCGAILTHNCVDHDGVGGGAYAWTVAEVRVGDEEIKPSHFSCREWKRIENALHAAKARSEAKQEQARLAREVAERKAAQERILAASLKSRSTAVRA